MNKSISNTEIEFVTFALGIGKTLGAVFLVSSFDILVAYFNHLYSEFKAISLDTFIFDAMTSLGLFGYYSASRITMRCLDPR